MNKGIKKTKLKIPFNKPHLGDNEMKYVMDAHKRGQLAGDGYYTKKCHHWIEKNIGAKKALLTHSCTAALEMMALVCELKPGDEVIMPSFTFVSTANAFALRGVIPVFVDIREDTLNINEKLIESAITKKTKAIMVVHYAGIGCDMKTIKNIAIKYNLILLEDSAQGLMSQYEEEYLGTIGHMGAISFHETKNVISGEGGVLLLNDKKFIEKAEVVRQKGTNRDKFLRGQVDKYTWVNLGSSYLPGELVAAYLYAQLRLTKSITRRRVNIWNKYHNHLEVLESKSLVRRPTIPKNVRFNGHLYYVLTRSGKERDELLKHLRNRGILSVFHYVPLHCSPGGLNYARYKGDMRVTNSVADTLIRLPVFYDLKDDEITDIVNNVKAFYK